ncbi:MAG: hypothetical protein AB7H43_10685 [Acidimicrobiia bacterium]
MATGHVILPVAGAYLPDGSGSGNAAARPTRTISSGTQTTNSAKVTLDELLFDPSTDQHAFWAFTLPSDYASGGTLRLTFSTRGTSANVVRWKAAAGILIPGTTDGDALVFDTVVGVDGTPSTTQGVTTQVTVALTMTNGAANRPIVIMVGRDPDHANDTNANDAVLVAATFEYLTT